MKICWNFMHLTGRDKSVARLRIVRNFSAHHSSTRRLAEWAKQLPRSRLVGTDPHVPIWITSG